MNKGLFHQLPVLPADMAHKKAVDFLVGKMNCVIDIMNVKEILAPAPFAPLPNTPSFILGAFDHRNAIVPIIDMEVRLDIKPLKQTKKKWIVVNVFKKNVALQVDTVKGVITLDESQKRDSNSLSDSFDESWIYNIYSVNGSLLFELNLETIADISEVVLKQTFLNSTQNE
jgi:purine-binding chemotaxis protein CheW